MESNQSPKTIDVYDIVTNRIIELLEAGTVPWQQSWNGTTVPMNLLSQRPYRGINLWLLMSLQYERNLFLTWDQLKTLGGSVNKDQHGHVVVFWKIVAKKPEELDGQGKPKTVPMLRYYKVFNIEQCRDIPENSIPLIETREFDPIAECESVVNGMPLCPKIQHKEQLPFYSIPHDLVNMPKKKSFNTSESYYSVLFHELVHSTGAEKRLNRKSLGDIKPFGLERYAMEELVAEMGAAFLCQHTGILPFEIESSAAYLNGWLEVLRNDKKFIISASGQAQRAADYILGRNGKDPIIETHHPVEIGD